MPDLSDLRARLAALPVDRAPLRRAGLLTVLLVVLVVATQALAPDMTPASATLGRQDVQSEAETRSAGSGTTLGRLGALALLVAGGGVALVLRRRSAPAQTASALEVLETHPLGQGHSLRLVACGDEVLLLDVGAEGARLLRQWPRGRFDGTTDVAVQHPEAAAAAGPPAIALVAQDEPTPEAGPMAEARAPTPVARRPTPTASAAASRVAAPPHQFGAPTAPSFADVLAQFSAPRG